jgi:transcriptional regulator with XRE-family HTH domain
MILKKLHLAFGISLTERGAKYMFDNEIISQGEKLKRIREMYSITQYELSEGICSRSNLSKIENNNQKLTFNLATGFAKRFNDIIEEKGLDIKSITADFLIKDENSQANDIFSIIVKELEEIREIDLAEQKLRKAEELIVKFNISDNIKIDLYKSMASIYYNKYKYIKSNAMCNNGLKICINSQNAEEEEVKLYIYIAMNSIKTFHYNEALKELTYAEQLNNNTRNTESSELILYHKGLAYKKLFEYDNALKCLKILIDKQTENKNLLIKAKMVYANCLMDQNILFEEAQKEYLEIIDLAYDDKDLTALAYKNLSELFFNGKKYKVAKKYINDALYYAPKNEYLNEIYYFAAKISQNLNEDFESYLLQALELCEQKDSENLILIEKIIYELVLVYSKRNNDKHILLMADKVEKLAINHDLIYAEIIKYYKGRNDEKCDYFLEKLIEKSKQIKNI